MAEVANQTLDELERGLDAVRAAPADSGALELIVRRPETDARELVDEAELDTACGLIGDIWSERPSHSTGAPNPAAQVTVMNARAAALVAAGDEHHDWAQAGDQLYVDFDIGVRNLPSGTRLRIGEAVLEVSEEPHLGCGKFVRRFGVDAMKLVNSPLGRELRLRGVNTRVAVPGRVARGDPVRKMSSGLPGAPAGRAPTDRF